MDRPAETRSQPSLDEIVGQSAVVIAQQIQSAASWAKSEMDLQVEVAGILKDFARQVKINLSGGHHNITIATGRPDSVYGSVIVEYKEPGNLSPNKDAANNKKVIDQLKKRFYDMRREENRQWNSMFGAGTDGKYFIFLRFRDDKWTDQEPLEVNRYSTERLLWALYNLGQKGKPYQPEYLHGDFGSDSQTAQEGVPALYEEWVTQSYARSAIVCGTSKGPRLSAGSKGYNSYRSADTYMTLGEKRSGIAPEGKEPQSNPAGHEIALLPAFPGIPGLGYVLSNHAERGLT